MKFLKNVINKSGHFTAFFTSGETTNEPMAAGFFIAMEDYGKDLEGAKDNATMGEMVDPTKPWPEIKRILTSFEKGQKDDQ